eukprot:TRINITY_DN14649_c0_g1_i10.p1 TRINITY_DN14649_c0_g1~~TRINITY_DN14649_c0_g1_i10.p1  ORF type:complete len:177 (-),score=65.28 TRINITY_DN14649_c0_g1_i10:577-1107(-)
MLRSLVGSEMCIRDRGKVVDEREAPAHIQKAREIRRRMDRQAMEKLAQASGGEDGDAIRMVSAAPRPMSKAELIYQERQERQRRRREAAARGTSEQLGTARKATYGEPDDVGLNPEDQEKLLEVFKNMSGFVEQTRASLETMDATDQEVGDLDARLVDSLQKLQQVVSNETSTQSD